MKVGLGQSRCGHVKGTHRGKTQSEGFVRLLHFLCYLRNKELCMCMRVHVFQVQSTHIIKGRSEKRYGFYATEPAVKAIWGIVMRLECDYVGVHREARQLK